MNGFILCQKSHIDLTSNHKLIYWNNNMKQPFMNYIFTLTGDFLILTFINILIEPSLYFIKSMNLILTITCICT